MNPTYELVCSIIITFNLLLFWGYGFNKLMTPHKDRVQVWGIITIFVSVWDFGYRIMSRIIAPLEVNPILNIPIDLAIGPLLYIYFSLVTDPDFRVRPRNLGLFLPSALFFFYKLPGFLATGHTPISYEEGYAIYAWFSLSMLLFVVKHSIQIKTKKIASTSLRRFFLIYAACWVCYGLIKILSLRTPPIYLAASVLATCMFIPAMIFFPRYTSNPWEEKGETDKYRKSKIKGMDVPAVLRKLDHLMKEKQVYQNEELTLPLLADQLGISPHQLSEMLNSVLKTNFKNYLNDWRIGAAKKLLKDEPELKVLEIALDCGFRSKSTFNSVFLKSTGMTPKEYQETQGSLIPS